MNYGSKNKGFTLLELLIVIAIIAILSAILIFVLNPAETLRKSRDNQRFSDLSTLKRALGLYALEVKEPSFGPVAKCEDAILAETGFLGGPGKIWLSAKVGFFISLQSHPDPTGEWDKIIGGDTLPCPEGNINNSAWAQRPCMSRARNIDGTGWLPINLTGMASGSPISVLPIDPVNKGDELNNATFEALLYRYTCKGKDTNYVCGAGTWEIDAVLESNEYNSKMADDGGDNPYYYETGTCLYLLPKCLPGDCGVGNDGKLF